MKSKFKAYLYLGLAFCFTLVCAVPLVKAMQLDAPVNAIGAMVVVQLEFSASRTVKKDSSLSLGMTTNN